MPNNLHQYVKEHTVTMISTKFFFIIVPKTSIMIFILLNYFMIVDLSNITSLNIFGSQTKLRKL